MKQDFPLAPLPRAAWITLAALAVISPLAALWLPRSSTSTTFLPAWLMVLLILIVATVGVLIALRRRRITIEDRQLIVAATLYTRRVPVDALDLQKARIVDLDEHTELRPGMRSNGFNLPGFQAGHYRMRNGGKAFCLLTDHHRVLAVPQRDGDMLLLSPEKPQVLLQALREAGLSTAR